MEIGNACSVCYGTGYDMQGMPCKCGSHQGWMRMDNNFYSMVQSLKDEITSLKAQLAAAEKQAIKATAANILLNEQLIECKKDAERYRWLRPRMTGKDTLMFARRKDLGDAYCTILDDDIDAAMAQKDGS